MSCATWESNPRTDNAGGQWALGYFTGANLFSSIAGGNGMIGNSTDQLGIIGEIKKVCHDHPSMALVDATGTVYFRMQKAAR